MKKEDICFMSATSLLEKIKTQELPSQEVTEILIERIEKINPLINAYCTPTFDIARQMAQKADQDVKKGNKLGLLHGIPTSIKDLTLTKGIRTTFGSKIFENFVPDVDEVAVERLKKQGCIILGKTNTPEFGHKGATDNLVFGATKNPWNLNRTSGGSSGGASSATAAGISTLALGSDGGGSIRIPSSLCGVYGIKPSFGRVPFYPISGYDFLSSKGPIARYVTDAALMLDVLKGSHDGDPYSLPDDDTSYFKLINETPRNLKIGYSLDLGIAKQVDPEIKKNILDSVYKFEEFDWTVDEVKIKMKDPHRAFSVTFCSIYAYLLRNEIKEWRNEMSPEFVKIIDSGMSYRGIDVARAQDITYQTYLSIYEHFKNYDILITPTLAVTAFKLGIMAPMKINNRGVSPTAWISFTFPFNMTGHPAASIPTGWSSEKLPIGMQIVGNRHSDLLVLQASKAFEEVAPWQDKRPEI